MQDPDAALTLTRTDATIDVGLGEIFVLRGPLHKEVVYCVSRTIDVEAGSGPIRLRWLGEDQPSSTERPARSRARWVDPAR